MSHRYSVLGFLSLFLLCCGQKEALPVETANRSSPAEEGKKTPASDKELDEVAVSCLYIDRCLERLKAEPESELLGDRVASIVLSAERTLPVFWGADPKTLSAPLREKIDSYPKKIREWVDRINEQKSRQTLVSIKAISLKHHEWGEANPDGKWQEHIERDDLTIQKIQNLVAGMSAGPSLDEATEILMAKRQLLNKLGRGQLTAYQKEALKHSHQFVSFSLQNTVIRDSVLLEEFNKAEIAKIDAGLLGADARRMYDTAINLMEGKLKERNRAEFLLKLTDTEKWPLTDY